MYSQLRDKASDWALKQWREVQQAESGMKFHVKRCALRRAFAAGARNTQGSRFCAAVTRGAVLATRRVSSAHTALSCHAAVPRRATAALLRYVSDEEVFLRGIPADSRACVVLHPPAADSSAVVAHLTELAKERRELHRRWYFLSWTALGVTVPLMIIPIIPAVPFYWNAFRIWGNRKAWIGSATLEELLAQPAFAAPLKPCTRTLACSASECCRVSAVVNAAGGARSVIVACDLLAAPHSAALAADEAGLAQAAAAVERALDAPGIAAHAHERLLAAQKLRREHGQQTL